MGKAPVIILEGSWWSDHEVPMVLPYFNALATSHQEIDLGYRTIRNAEDIKYYVSRISKNARAMLYFACHGSNLTLYPSEGCAVEMDELIAALTCAKRGAVSFVHFGCCEMVDPNNRRRSHKKILDCCRAKWVSGYTTSVDWLQSMFLDLALVYEVFVPTHHNVLSVQRVIKRNAESFVKTYEQLARALGFSALSNVSGRQLLFPKRLHQ